MSLRDHRDLLMCAPGRLILKAHTHDSRIPSPLHNTQVVGMVILKFLPNSDDLHHPTWLPI